MSCSNNYVLLFNDYGKSILCNSQSWGGNMAAQNLNVVQQFKKCGCANSGSVTVFPLLSLRFAGCHIHIGHMLEKLTVQHPFSDSSHLSNRQTKQNATLEPYRFHKLMETFISHSQPQWKCLPSMEKSGCQCVVHWCLGLQISTERRR